MNEIAAGDGDPHRAEAGDQLPGLADLPREQLRVDRAAVDVLQRDPAPRQEPVQFDDPAHEIRIGLLPERFATLAEELVDQGRDAVGERIGVEQRIVERVPLPGTAEADLQVVVPAPGLLEDPPHVVAEAGISLRKSLWDNDLATPCERRVSPGVSEGRKWRYPLGLRQKRRDLEARPQHDRPTLSAARPPSRKD